MTEKKPARLTRRKADEIISLLPERARRINEDPQHLYKVERIVVFGSYLTDKDELSGLDIAVQMSPKDKSPGHADRCLKQGEQAGQHGFSARIFWPQAKVGRALRGRNLRVSLHHYGEYEMLVSEGRAQGREIFPDR